MLAEKDDVTMLKSLIKRWLFKSSGVNRIRFGPSSGMLAQYDPLHRSQHLLGLYELEIAGLIRRSMSKANVLIDIGANDGYYGLAFAKQKNKEIILCEPGVAKADLLINMQQNGFMEGKDFTLIDKFVSSRNTPTEISINELVKGRDKVFVLMDVDGAEEGILRSFDFNSNSKIEWVIETHSAELEKNIISIFEANHYETRVIKTAWWRKIVPEQRPLAQNRWLYAKPTEK